MVDYVVLKVKVLNRFFAAKGFKNLAKLFHIQTRPS